MAADNETIADIVADLRKRGMFSTANRIEAAWKREKSEIEASALSVGGVVEASRRLIKIPVEIVPTCSVAAMRDVLMFLRKKIDEIHTAAVVNGGNRNAIIMACGGLCARIDSALATRPRNCDVYAYALWDTISRAWQDWLLTPEFNKRKIGGMKEFCYWFLGPAKEGAVRK